mgnify:CR=1 FL=1
MCIRDCHLNKLPITGCKNALSGHRDTTKFDCLQMAIDLISTYVANGFGIGLSLALPGDKAPKGVRLLPLKDFPAVTIGALWRGKRSELSRHIVDQLKARAGSL